VDRSRDHWPDFVSTDFVNGDVLEQRSDCQVLKHCDTCS
jgi:hypothetical protein